MGLPIGIHEKTGVLELKVKHSCEPYHIVVEGEIASKKTERKPGVWQFDEGRTEIFFTCPWCRAIGRTETRYIDVPNAESLWCRPCGRHLTLFFRSNGNEQKYFFGCG